MVMACLTLKNKTPTYSYQLLLLLITVCYWHATSERFIIKGNLQLFVLPVGAIKLG
jgi:hypothetical protein